MKGYGRLHTAISADANRLCQGHNNERLCITMRDVYRQSRLTCVEFIRGTCKGLTVPFSGDYLRLDR